MPRRLPVLRSTTGCDRRELLLGLGLGALLAGCRMSLEDGELGEGESNDPGTGSASGSQASSGVAACEGGICLDLTHPENVALTEVGGFRVIMAQRKLVVVRVGEADFVALSAICTHAGSLVTYDSSRGDIVCRSHGSRFALDGQVTASPASAPLRAFDTSFDATTDTLTIVV